MLSKKIAAFLLPALLGHAIATVVPDEPPLPGYDIFIPEWDVEVTPGGEIVTLKGTIEEVTEELRAINPNFDQEWGLKPRSEYDDNAVEAVEEEAGVEKRTDFSGTKVLCQIFDNCNVQVIKNDISYLRGVPGKPSNGAGPGNCGRVACHNSCGIWWCNDTKSTKTLNSFGSIADGAQRIVDVCYTNNKKWTINGQAFHGTGWNVIARAANC